MTQSDNETQMDRSSQAKNEQAGAANNPQRPYLIVLGNEKGGSGKSTTAMHIVAALQQAGARVGAMDLDGRQGTLARYVENRRAFAEKNGLVDSLPIPPCVLVKRSEDGDRGHADADEKARFEAAYGTLADACDAIVIDCPGADTYLARLAHTAADTLITPVNDSFVDLDLLARIDADTYKVEGPSLYAEMVWKARQRRMMADGHSIDWVVIRNRVGMLHAKNKKRVEGVLDALVKRIGMRFVPGLSERVIYREMFLKGLTLLDLKTVSLDGSGKKGLTMSQVTARSEVRDLLASLNLPAYLTAGSKHHSAPNEAQANEDAKTDDAAKAVASQSGKSAKAEIEGAGA